MNDLPLPASDIPFILSDEIEWGGLFAEIEPAPTGWRPWPGRTSRWWYEIGERKEGDEMYWTRAYQPKGSGGGFTLKACIHRAAEALDHFAALGGTDE